MTFDSIAIPVLAFLVGWLGNSVVWMWKLGNRLTRVETVLEMVQKKVDAFKVDEPPCSFHADLRNDYMEFKGRVESRLEQ